ncbi:MAG: beta-aspartyl-peptidase [Clostridium sp.]|uniref:beta-aspartyl-peptidase n=1 Tax=Clostridium sp. TaxID=1506 RepID=UPI003D6CCE7C
MITIIKNGEVYAPDYIGKKDIIIAGGKIEAIVENITIPQNFAPVKVINAEGKLVFPGFIDAHVHIIGGGGEGGFKTRTPEINLSDIVASGITTVVGCLGTDGVCRDLKALLAKSRALEEEGISTYIYSGSYEIPVSTMTNSCKSDIMLIDKVIGIGEVAISDHRSSQPTYEEFIKVVADARVGGLLSGKAGVVNVHLGYGERRLQYLVRMIKETEIPIKQVIPTHINRSTSLFEAGIEFAKLGGIIDITTSSDPDHLGKDEVKASTALKIALERGIPVEQIQFTSDGQGSLPIFNKKREFIGLGIGSTKSLYIEVRDAVLKDGVDLEVALKVITSNVATNLKLYNKGVVQENKDADLVIVNKSDLTIQTVFAKGVEMVSEGKVVVIGTFEKNF